MLVRLLIRLELEVQGMALPRLVQEATGVHHMTFRRQGFSAIKTAQDLRRFQEEWLGKNLLAWGESSKGAGNFLDEAPEGPVARIAFALGLLSPESIVHKLFHALDAADARMGDAVDRKDHAAIAHELGPQSPLGHAYCAPLHAAGLKPSLLEGPYTRDSVGERARTRRAHMALAFLAGLDHEFVRRREKALGIGEWDGRPHLAVLLAPPPAKVKLRQTSNDPFARLVDLVGGAGMAAPSGHWPTRAPSISMMAKKVDASGVLSPESDSTRYVRSLRSGSRPMRITTFRRFVRSQWPVSEPSSGDYLDAAGVLFPHLIAAHLFTLLMPECPEKPGHRDRRGWRGAYLSWWERIGNELGRRTSPATECEPKWLLEP